jgi:acyl-CoA thioesterase
MSMGTDHAASIRSRAEEMYARDLTCQTLGIHLDEVGPGRARLRMRITAGMTNGHGMAHGGYLFLLADAAFAYACNSYGPVTVAHNAQITFLRPAAVDDELLAEAVERARYGRNGVYDVTISQVHGETIAEFRGHSTVIAGSPTIPRESES